MNVGSKNKATRWIRISGLGEHLMDTLAIQCNADFPDRHRDDAGFRHPPGSGA